MYSPATFSNATRCAWFRAPSGCGRRRLIPFAKGAATDAVQWLRLDRITMHIGTLTIVVHLRDAASLKDKRQIIKSLIETARQKFNVSIAEIDDLDMWRRATIGVACVANDIRHVNRVLDTLLDTLDGNPCIDVGEVEMDID